MNVISERSSSETIQMRLAAIVEHSDDAIIGSDLTSTITDWNRGAEHVFGYTADEMVGKSILALIPAERQEEEKQILHAILRGETVRHFETLRQTKSGRLIDVSITASPIKDSSGRTIGIAKIARDISAEKEHARELDRTRRLYAALSQVNQAIVWTKTREELFQKVCEVLVQHGGFHMACISEHDPATQELVPRAVFGDPEDYIASVKVYADDRPEGRGPSGLAFRTGLPCICNDIRADPAALPWRQELLRHGFQASAAFPIRLRGAAHGTLSVYSDEAHYFQDKEVALLKEAAGDVSFGLENLAEKEVRLQAELAAQNERLFSFTMIESMPGVLYFYDESGRFLRWNRNFETVSGYSGRQIAGMHPLDFFPEAEKESVRQRITEVFDKGTSFIEASLLSTDGVLTPYFFTGRKVVFEGRTCLVGMGIDVSERTRAEQAREEMEKRYRTLFEQAPDGIVIANREAFYIDANVSVCRMLGYTRDEFVGLHSSDIVASDQTARIEPAVDAILTSSGYHQEWQFRRRDGTCFPAEVIATTMPDGNILAMIRDITERKRAEQELRSLNENLEVEVAARTADLRSALIRAEAADRLKSAFLATMSHELRTPLNSIIGFTGIVLQGLAGPLNEEQSKQLGMVRGSARHLLALINDVLDLSKIEAGQLEVRAESFSLEEALTRVSELVEPLAAKKGLDIQLDIPKDTGEMVSDRRRVEQILLNLINNAIKFTERGCVKVVVENLASHPFAAEPGPAVCIRVRDTGIGIKAGDMASLFQPFRQIDAGIARQHEGTGLGLAICRRLADILGGEIHATSEWAVGSEFIVTLPRQPSSSVL